MSRPTILLTGAGGQIGFELRTTLAGHGDVVALDRAALDIADADAIVTTVRRLRPQLIVNAAAYTAVDRAEKEPELAHSINARAPAIFAAEAKRLDAVLIHYSTDYVFDGARATPYAEDSPAHPLNVYGASKLEGERAVAAVGAFSVVLRTSWVYGRLGSNFLMTMRRLARERDEIRVVDDQIGVPNWSRAVATGTAQLLASGVSALKERKGLYHMSAQGQASWFEFARAVIGDVDRPRIVAISTAEYATPARRPAYSVLATRKLAASFGVVLPHWRLVLRECLESRQ